MNDYPFEETQAQSIKVEETPSVIIRQDKANNTWSIVDEVKWQPIKSVGSCVLKNVTYENTDSNARGCGAGRHAGVARGQLLPAGSSVNLGKTHAVNYDAHRGQFYDTAGKITKSELLILAEGGRAIHVRA